MIAAGKRIVGCRQRSAGRQDFRGSIPAGALWQSLSFNIPLVPNPCHRFLCVPSSRPAAVKATGLAVQPFASRLNQHRTRFLREQTAEFLQRRRDHDWLLQTIRHGILRFQPIAGDAEDDFLMAGQTALFD